MNYLPKISVVICTRDRPKDLSDLLYSILKQNYLPYEVLIIDDSPKETANKIYNNVRSKFQSTSCNICYAQGLGNGLTAARNLGITLFKGDAILFLDDDTLLDRNVVKVLSTFLMNCPSANGVQLRILNTNRSKEGSLQTIENLIYKVLMLSYGDVNKMSVRRSGASVYFSDLRTVVNVQRLSGCCCYRRNVFTDFSFDINLKRWGFMEDLDFSYRVYKKHPHSLYAIPGAYIYHNVSNVARLPNKNVLQMTTIYWSYIFFKDVFEGSLLNLGSFLWALIGKLVTTMSALVLRKKTKEHWWEFIYLISSYYNMFIHLKEIKSGKLDFFNKTLYEKVDNK